MERSPFEELVRRALLDVNYQEFEQIVAQADAIAYTPSPRYLAWERKFLAAPFDYAKKRSRPAWQRFLRAAACIVLAVSVAFGGLMAASPTARAWVQQIFAQWFGEYARFSFSGNAGQETGEWKTTWLPEGFELVEETKLTRMIKIIYQDKAGNILQLNYAPGERAIFGSDTEYQNYEEVSLHKTPAYLLRATSSGEASYLVWTNNGVAFKLITTANADDLLLLANGIQKNK